MRKIAVVLFALAVMCVSGEPPAGKKSETKTLGLIEIKNEWGVILKSERFEVYEDWERGYFIYKQTNRTNSDSGGWSVSVTAVPIRSDWPVSQRGEPPKQTAEEGK